MATDFNYGNKAIAASGPFKPTDKNIPIDARTRVDTYADIETIPNPFISMKVTVLADETNNNEMTDYIVKSLKANSYGMPNAVIDEVVRYVDYLGVSTGEGLTSTQKEQLQTAYEHSQSKHVQSNDIPTKVSDLENDSNFVTNSEMTEAINNIQLNKNINVKKIINVLDLGIVPTNNTSEAIETNTTILKNAIDEHYDGSVAFFFPLGVYNFNLIEITEETKPYTIILMGQEVGDNPNTYVPESKRIVINTNGTNGFINRINTAGETSIRFVVSNIAFKQSTGYSSKPLGKCLGSTTNSGGEYNFDFRNVMFHGYEYGFYSPGYTCGGSNGERLTFSHCKYGMYITDASHRLIIKDVEILYCKYGIRLGVGGVPCKITDIHVAVGCFEGMNDYILENPLMYAIHTKGSVIIDGIYYEQYSGQLDVSNYYLIHYEGWAGGKLAKTIIKNVPLGYMGAGDKGYTFYGKKFVGPGEEMNTSNPLAISKCSIGGFFKNGCVEFENCLLSNSDDVTLISSVCNFNGDPFGYRFDGKDIFRDGVACSRYYTRGFNNSLAKSGNPQSVVDDTTLIAQYSMVNATAAGEPIIYDGITVSSSPIYDNLENSRGVHYKGKITIKGLTSETTNIILGIVGKVNNIKTLIRDLIPINKELIGKKATVFVDEYIPKSECENVFFGYKCINNTSEAISLSEASNIIYDIISINDDVNLPKNKGFSNSFIYISNSNYEITNNYGQIITSNNTLTLEEGSETTFNVSLDSAPSVNQTITISINNDNVSIDKNNLLFTPSDYNIEQTVKVIAKHDSSNYSNVNSIITLSNPNIDSKSISVEVTNIDTEKTLSSISATYTQGSTVVYPSTSLDSLKNNLVVKAIYSDSSEEIITNYTLSGTLTVGTSTITVTYNNKTTTFDVAVSENSTMNSDAYLSDGYFYVKPELLNKIMNSTTNRDNSESPDNNHKYFNIASGIYSLSGVSGASLSDNASILHGDTISYAGKHTLSEFNTNSIECADTSYICDGNIAYIRIPMTSYTENSNNCLEALSSIVPVLAIKNLKTFNEVTITDSMIDQIASRIIVNTASKDGECYVGYIDINTDITGITYNIINNYCSLGGVSTNTYSGNDYENWYVNATGGRINYRIPYGKITGDSLDEIKDYLKNNRLTFYVEQ